MAIAGLAELAGGLGRGGPPIAPRPAGGPRWRGAAAERKRHFRRKCFSTGAAGVEHPFVPKQFSPAGVTKARAAVSRAGRYCRKPP